MKKCFIVLVVATLSCSFSCFSFAPEPQWQIGGAAERNLISDGGYRLAYQGAVYIAPDQRGCVLVDGLGPSVPVNTGGQAAESIAAYFKEVSGAFYDPGRAVIDVAQRVKENKTFVRAGASVIAATFLADAVRITLVGNARAVMCRGGLAHALSFDQTPNRPDEHDRLLRAGKKIEHDNGVRVDGLPVSRVIGYSLCGGALAAKPEMYTVPLSVFDEFVVLGCAGLWSVMDNQAAVEIVQQELRAGAAPEEAAQALVTAAKNGTRGARAKGQTSITALVAHRIPTRQQMVSSGAAMQAGRALLSMPQKDWLPATTALHPLVKALIAAEKYCGFAHAVSLPQQATQQAFSDLFLPHNTSHRVLEQYFGLHRLNQKELQAWVSDDVDVINALLKREGFDIRLTKESVRPEDAFYVASILNVIVQWRTKGRKTGIRMSGAWYDAVAHDQHVATYNVPDYPHPVFAIATKSNDLVFMTKATEPLDNFALFSRVASLQRDVCLAKKQYDELIFPMVDLSEEGNISWLLGLRVGDYRISQALQQTIFKMNEQGAQAKSAAVLAFVATAVSVDMKKTYTIDEPFYCWISRPGMRHPLFAGYLQPTCWKNPGTVTDIVEKDSFSGVEPLRICNP